MEMLSINNYYYYFIIIINSNLTPIKIRVDEKLHFSDLTY